MSLFAKILDVHLDILTSRHYDPRSLRTMDPEKDLLTKLENAFSEAIHKNVWTKKPAHFKIGLVHQTEDHPVSYQFEYRYDPGHYGRIKLELLSMRAELLGHNKTYLITDNKPHLLPVPETVNQDLLAEVSLALPKQQTAIPNPSPRRHRRVHLLLPLILLSALLTGHPARAQMDRTEMLEQIAKLQLYISQAEKGYQLIREGLTTIGNIKKGDFDLHSLFFQSLSLVNPQIRGYIKIADIITMQVQMVSAYHQSYGRCQSSGLFGKSELGYIYSYYGGLMNSTADDITELTGIITDGDFQMDDAQRLARIDKLYATVSARYRSLNGFSNQLQFALLQKSQAQGDLQNLSKLIQP